MPTQQNRKQRTRALASALNVSYSEAANYLTQHPQCITIQQALRADGVLPYPFHIKPGGMIARQDFWRGKAYRLVGFQADPDRMAIDVGFKKFYADPTSAIGLFPVLADDQENWSTYCGTPIASVKVL